MKRLFTLVAVALIFAGTSLAQAPEMINYQAVARDGSGNILSNQSINVTFKIHSGSAGGTVVFEENHNGITTNDFGLFSLQIGDGTNVSGSIGGTDWGGDSQWLEVEVNGASLGTQQLASVPYALEAAGPWERVGSELSYMENVGIGVSNPSYRLHVSTTSPAVAQFDGGNSAYIRISEGGTQRAYMGSYSGDPEDADFGTVVGSTGKTHLVTDATPRLTIDAGGRVGVGTTSPQVNIHMMHSTGGPSSGDGFTLENIGANGNYWTQYVQNSIADFYLYFKNTYKGSFDDVTGAYSSVSDARMKREIEPIGNLLDKVKQLQMMRYKMISDETDRQCIGALAQEVEPLFPEMVYHHHDDNGSEHYSMDYSMFGVVAIKAIQEQQEIIETMQTEIETLKKELNELKK